MSGGDARGPAGGGGSGDEPCRGLRQEKNLESPVPGVAELLKVDDELDLDLRDGPPRTVVLVDRAGRDAGAIVATGRLIECLQDGVRFVASVTQIRGGAIWLEVRAAE
jgi:hypothetical protein